MTGPDFISLQRVLINAGGDVALGNVDAIDALVVTGQNVNALSLDGQTVDVTASGLIDVGTATSETTIDFLATDIKLANADAVQNITLDAMGGAISLGTINSENQLIATASGDIDFTNLTGLVVTLDAGGAITGGSAAADRNIISGTPRNVNLTAVGAIDIDSASAVNSVIASGANFTATSVDAGNIISVNVPGAIDIGTSDSGNETVLTGGTVLLGSGVAVGGISAITATAGPVNIGAFDTNNFLDITSDTSVDFGTLTARAMTIIANGNVTGTRAATDVNLISGRPRNVNINTTGAVNVGQIDTVNSIVISAASVDSDLFDAGGDISVSVSGLADIVQINSTDSTTITGSSILIGNGVSTGLALLTSTAGNVTLGNWDTQGFFDIDSAQDAIFDTVTGRVVDIVAVGDISGTSAATDVALISGRPRNVNLDAGGLVTIGNTASIGNTIVNGGAVKAGTLGANGTVTVTASGAAEADNLQSGMAASVTGADVTLVDGDVGGALTANALTGDLAITGTMSVGGNINLDAFRNINFGVLGTTGGSLDANAGRDIIFNSASANIDVDLIANGVVGGNVVNGRIVTVNSGSIDIGSLTATFSSDIDSTQADIMIGTLNSSGNTNLNAARSLIVNDGVTGVFTGIAVNDITLGNLTTTGAFADIRLTAGGTAGYSLIDGDRLVVIDAGSIQGGTIIADAQTTLTGGTINIGDVTADTGFIVLESTVGNLRAGNLTALVNGVQIASAADLAIGTTSGTSLTTNSVGGTVMGDAAFTGTISIIADGTLDAGHLDSNAVSPGLGVTTGGDARIASATADGLLTLEIGGALTGGDFSGSGVTTVNADSVNIASVESRAGTLQVDATGEIVIDQIGSAFATNLTGGSVTVNNGAVGGIFNVSATAGDIAGTGTITAGGAISLNATGNIGFGTLDATNGNFRATAGGDINFAGASSNAIVDFAAGGVINGGDVDAGITLTLDAGRIAIGNATGRNINLTSASDILFDSLTTPNALSVTALNGMIGANTGSGDIDAGSTVTLLSREIAVGDVSSGGAVNAQATAGDAAFGTVDAATSIAIVATGTPTLANAISGGDTSVTGASVMFDNGAIGGSLALSATAGNIASNGAVTVAGGITLDAIGDVRFGSLKAQNGDFTISAGGNVLATHAEASGDFRSSSAGTFTTGLNSIITGGDIIIASGNAVNLGNSTAGGLINVTGSQIDFVNLIAGQTIDLLTIITPNTSGGNGNIAGTNMTAGAGASSATSAGSIAINGVSDIGGSLTLDAANDITIGQSDVRGGDLLATAGGTITSGAATVSGALDFLAANSILITGNVLAGGLVSIEAVNGSISGQDISAGAGADIGAQTTILLGDVTLAAGGASVSANGNIVLGSISGADSAGIAITSGAGSVSFTDLAADGGISILAEIGALTGNDIASGGAVSVDGDSVALHNVTSGDDLFGIAESGTFTLNSADSAGEIFISVATQSDIGSLAAATDITVSGGNIGLGQATAGGDIELTSGGAFGIVTGSLTSGGRLVIGAGLDGFTGTTLDAGSVINIDSNGDVSLGDAAAGANLLIDTINGSVIADSLFSAANIFVDAGGDVAVGSAATANSGQGLVDIISDGAITIADVAGNSAYLEARGGDLVVDQSINVVGLVEAYGESILLRTPGNLAVTAEASDGTINIVVGGDLDIQGASAPGNIDLTSTGGSAQVNAVVVNLGAAPTPGVQGTQQITTSGGNVTITAASDVTVNSFIDAANTLTIAAGGLLDLRATASGADIDVVAADINIDANGALGRSDRTDTILIASGSDIYLGGAGGLSTGFELDKDEFTRVFSGGDITVEAFAVTTGGSGNLTVDDLDVLAVTATASPTATDGNIAANGTLTLSAAGSVDVIGGLTVINAGTDTNLAIFAANQINVDVDSGNLRMEEDTNVLGGNIELSAPSIFAISSAAAANIAGAALDDIDQRLGQNDGFVRDEGYFQATNLTFNIDNDLLIQNSGAGTDFADRRGFTADSVTINEIDAVDPLRIVINGVVDGNTGLDAVSLVNITTAFDPLSTINGCLIASPSSCVIVPETPETSIDNPLQDLIDEEIGKDSPTEVSVSTMIIQFRDDPEREPDPLINEPVTGAGNEDLWVSEDDCDTSAETCEVATEEELEPAE
ncbi:MAG: hypothetical protein WAT93_05290 [Pontixanthobacter sp.]